MSERTQLADALRTEFPHLAASDTALSPIRGGRAAGLAALAAVDPVTYERSRNFLSGAVTRLSAYLRHGVLTLAEVRDAALDRVKQPEAAGKLVNELAWRDYWQRLYEHLGEGIWQDREGYKTGWRAQDYAGTLPDAISAGMTTLACMDGFARQLRETGYLHNHARMWTAAYVVHWRRVRWQAGARWFLEHLVDGDPASNNLSWQWVASTFASKAYIFNRENLERYTNGEYCRKCSHAAARTCPFDRDYESLGEELFPRLRDGQESGGMQPTPRSPADTKPSAPGAGKALLWVHTDGLNPAVVKPVPSVFVWDREWMEKSRISLKRLVFLAECLAEMPAGLDLRVGDVAAEVLASARLQDADYVLVQRTPDPRLRAAALVLERSLPVVWYDVPPFVEAGRGFELKRFSRYWQRAQSSAMQRTR